MFESLSLRNRILAIVALAGGVCAVVAIFGFLHFNERELENGIVARERTIHLQLDAATDYVARQGGLPAVIERIRGKFSSPEELSAEDKLAVLNQVPIFAAMKIGHKNAETDNYNFRIFSDAPRRKENQATAAELEILRRFEKDPGLTELVTNEKGLITMYRPVRLSENQGCMTCHGAPQTSPWGNGRDILGFPMENWSDGKLHGVMAVSQETATVAAARNEGHLITPAGWLILAISIGALLSVAAGAWLVRGPLGSLSQVASMLAGSSTEVSAMSRQIAGTARGISEAASRQASALEETSASIEQMSGMVGKNAENASATASSSDASRGTAEHGRKVVERMIQSMKDIDQSNSDVMERITRSNAEMTEIVNVIQNIGAKTRVINDIVFKTQLLSFNASVEAARAGEHGQGFAVVAEEVGKLAQMSGGAAQEISDLLEGSLQKVEDIVGRTQTEVEKLIAKGKQNVDDGARIAEDCGRVLGEIVENVAQVSRMAGEISSASREQDQGVRELTKAMNQLDQVTQQNASRSQEAAGAATGLSTQAQSLNQAVRRLLDTIEGRGEHAAAPVHDEPAPDETSAPPEKWNRAA